MCQEIDNNEKRLRKVVFEMKTFTENELANKLEQCGRNALFLKPFWSLKRYLEEFEDMGLLTYEDGTYTTEKSFTEKRTRLSPCS